MEEEPKNQIGWFGVVVILTIAIAIGAYFAGAR